jgi:hypothetical protein
VSMVFCVCDCRLCTICVVCVYFYRRRWDLHVRFSVIQDSFSRDKVITYSKGLFGGGVHLLVPIF